MNKSGIVAWRELRERTASRSFLLVTFIGPLLVLGIIYSLFAIGGKTKTHWNVLITDPANIMDHKVMASENKAMTYSFADNYIEVEEFANAKKYRQYDAMVEINEKILGNKSGFVFYREEPSERIRILIRYQMERRLEEVMVGQFTNLDINKFRQIKQPVTFAFRNAYDPKGESPVVQGWVGFVFGALIFLFIFLFGMTILRSVTREKANRVIEVLLASIRPNQLMLGKITGIGISALLQMLVWILVIGSGLYLMRETLFPDFGDAANMDLMQAATARGDSYAERYFSAVEYNEFVELIYNRIRFGIMLFYFVLFFVVAYLFYGAFFVSIGASMGSESDGQQFVFPLILLFLLGLYAGYHTVYYPTDELTTWMQYLPFTAPMVSMVRLSMGYRVGTEYELYLSLFILLVSALGMLALSNRVFTNGVLQFGHRLRVRHIVRWMKKN